MTRTETAAGWRVLVYEARALIQAPEDGDGFLGEAELRELATKLIWAADRMAARRS